MEPRFQTSFIPKKAAVASSTETHKSSVNLFAVVSILVFIMTLAGAGAVYFYGNLLTKSKADTESEIKKYQNRIDLNWINRKAVPFDTRIGVAKTLLQNHVAFSQFFKTLAASTVKTVRFRDFSYQYLSDDKITVTLKGEAVSFSAIAYQSDFFTQKGTFREFVIGDLSLQSDSTVGFSVVGTINPKSIAYSNLVISTSPSTDVASSTPVATTTAPNQ